MQRTVNRGEDVFNPRRIKIGCSGDAPRLHELKTSRERLDRSIHPIAPNPSQFDQIVRRSQRDQKLSAIAQHPPELFRIHAARDREQQRKRTVGVGKHPIGIRDDPFALRISPRCRIHGGNRNIDPVRLKPNFPGERAEIKAIAATRVENAIVGRGRGQFRNPAEQRLAHSPIVQSAPRRHALRRIAGIFGFSVLRLEQIDVAAPGDVERVPARAHHAFRLAGFFFSCERKLASAHGTDEHGSSVANPGPSPCNFRGTGRY